LALLGKPKQAKLRVWETHGKLASFNEDIVAGPERTFTLKREATGEMCGPFPLRRDAEVRIGTKIFTLAEAKDQPSASQPAVPDSGRIPVQFLLQHGYEKSPPFPFTDGAKVILGKEPFVLKLGKPPVAKGPAAKASSTTKPATKDADEATTRPANQTTTRPADISADK
jgi:hypothetical protein